MRNSVFRILLSAATTFCLILVTTVVKAGPVKTSQVVQVVGSNPTRTGKTAATQIRFAAQDPPVTTSGEQPPRVEGEIEGIITEEGPCDCPPIPDVEVPIKNRPFPFWVLGFAAIPIGFLIFRKRDKDSTPTPTPTDSPTPTPTMTPTVTPTITPPMDTPTPPTTVPEPMTLLLFGTGLTGLGAAVRRRMRKRLEQDNLVDEKSGDE